MRYHISTCGYCALAVPVMGTACPGHTDLTAFLQRGGEEATEGRHLLVEAVGWASVEEGAAVHWAQAWSLSSLGVCRIVLVAEEARAVVLERVVAEQEEAAVFVLWR